MKLCHIADVQTQPMETSYRLAVERVRANAERIRRVELPAYEQLINVRAKRYRLLADVYSRLRRRRADVTPDGEYCAWRRLLDADPGSCDCSASADDEAQPTGTTASGRGGNSSSTMPVFDGCDLPPVEPTIHHRSSPSSSALSSNQSLVCCVLQHECWIEQRKQRSKQIRSNTSSDSERIARLMSRNKRVFRTSTTSHS